MEENSSNYLNRPLSRSEVDATKGAVVVNFGTDWCTHCQAAKPLVAEAMARHPAVRQIKVEDGKGRPLGRSFAVKLWPTLVFLCDGKEIDRLVRPSQTRTIDQALTRIDAPSPGGDGTQTDGRSPGIPLEPGT